MRTWTDGEIPGQAVAPQETSAQPQEDTRDEEAATSIAAANGISMNVAIDTFASWKSFLEERVLHQRLLTLSLK